MAEKILVVDDDPDTVKILDIYLQRLGYEVTIAQSGLQALELAHKILPDLIILDVMMPGMDGFEVAQSLHRLPDTATIPILMITARSSQEDKNKGYDAGVDIYLTKPLHQMEFQSNLRTLLLKRMAQKQALSRQGYVVGVLAAKGGLGVSTTAINLAVSLWKKYKAKVIAAEMHPGSGTWQDELALSGPCGLRALLQMESSDLLPRQVAGHLTSTTFGVNLLLASNLDTEPIFPSSIEHYALVVSNLSALAELLVLDIGTYSSPAFPVIVEHCNEVVLVTEPQTPTVKQTCRLITLLQQHGFGSSKPISVVSVNHTRSDAILSASQMENMLQRPLALGFPPALELAAHAVSKGLPLCVDQPDSLAAQQFARLAEIVKKHTENV